MKPEDSARMRDILASNRTLLGWIRTAVSFAGLGFVVSRFGLFLASGKTNEQPSGDLVHAAGYIGTFMTVMGLLLTILGYIQHSSVLRQEKAPPGAPQPLTWVAVVAAAACALSCALLAVYLILSPSR